MLIKGASGKENKIDTLSNQFYTNIPHDFGMKLPPPINHIGTVRSKIKMLQTLEDLNTNHKLLIDAMQRLENENPADVYNSLINTNLTPVSENSDLFEVLASAIYTTHSSEHSRYSLIVDKIYEVQK